MGKAIITFTYAEIGAKKNKIAPKNPTNRQINKAQKGKNPTKFKFNEAIRIRTDSQQFNSAREKYLQAK